MIEAGLEFPFTSRRTALQALLSLPSELVPTQIVRNEGEKSKAIGRDTFFLDAADKRETGLLLEGDAGSFDVSFAGTKPIEIRCMLDTSPELAKTFLIHMASARPVFGFACAPQERERRNRVTTRQGLNVIESWVGRDTQRYVPGLYWLTLLPNALAERHRVPLPPLMDAALEHVALDGDQHLLRFYREPSDWRRMDDPASYIPEARPGVFDIEQIKAKMEAATTFAALDDLSRGWP